MRNPCGLHIQAQSKGFNRQALIDHVRRAEYETVTVLDDLTLAIDLQLPYAVFRAYSFEPQPKQNTQASGYEAADAAFGQLVSWRKTHPGSENVLFMVNCERGFGLGVSWMYARLIARCATEISPPIGLCVGNWASGAVKCGQGGEPNAWVDAGEPLLRALDQYKHVRLPNGSRAFVVGNHDYTGIHAWIAANGGEKRLNPRWEDRPRAIDWNKPQWHLGRMIQGMMAACKYFNIADVPPVIITECLIDDMDDVAYTFGNRATGMTGLKLAAGYNKARGWRSLSPQWAEWYSKDPAEVLADMHTWTWETLYGPLGFVIGTHAYTYGDGSQDARLWTSFRVDEADGQAYRTKMEAYRPGVQPPPALPRLVIAADDPRWRSAKALTKGGVALVRDQPSVSASRLDAIQIGGEWIETIPASELTTAERAYAEPAGDVPWYPVKTLKRIVGWTRSDVVDISESTPSVPTDGVVVSKAALAKLRQQMEELTGLIDEDNQRRQAVTLKLADANATLEDLAP